jgi:exonuclease VII small subunit
MGARAEVTFVKGGKERTMNTEQIGKKASKRKKASKKSQVIDEPNETPDPYPIPVDQPDDRVVELVDTITQLEDENAKLKDTIAIAQWDASEFEKIDIEQTVAELREKVRVLEIDNQALRESRDLYQARYTEAVKTIKSLQSKLKKA